MNGTHPLIRERYASTPGVRCWDEAADLIEYLLKEIAPYPEEVFVCNMDGIPPGRLVSQRDPSESRARQEGLPGRYTLRAGDCLKAAKIWREVTECLDQLRAWPRVPVEMALRFSSGAVTPLWGDYVLQLVTEGASTS